MKKTYAEINVEEGAKRFLLLVGVVSFVGIVSFYYSFFNLQNFRISDSTVAVISLTIFAIVSIAVREIYVYYEQYGNKVIDDIETNQRGVDGEALARPVILNTIGTNDRFFFNKKLPIGGDIDCLILGKKGLLLIEIKNFSKKIYLLPFRIKGFYDPRDEAIKHAKKLRKYLIANGCKNRLYVTASVLYINPEVKYFGKKHVFNIRGLDKFVHYFNGLPNNTDMSDEDIIQIALLLEKLK